MALVNAKNVYNDPEATAEEITNAKIAIEAAMAGLVSKPTAPVDSNVSDTVKSGDTTVNVAKTGDTTSFAGVTGLAASLTALAYLFVSKKKKD